MVAAGRVKPTSTALKTALPPRTRAIARRFVAIPDTVSIDRATAMGELRALSDRMEPFRGRLSAAMPPDSPARRLNFPVLHAMARRSDYPDE